MVKLLIVDEVHLLAEDRGSVIESIIARTLRQVEISQSMVRIVGLSATLPNYQDVAVFLRCHPETGLFFFDATYRPVPLSQTFIGALERNAFRRLQQMTDICYEKVPACFALHFFSPSPLSFFATLAFSHCLLHSVQMRASVMAGNQVLVFVHSRKDTVNTANQLLEIATSRGEASMFQPNVVPTWARRAMEKTRSREVSLFLPLSLTHFTRFSSSPALYLLLSPAGPHSL